MLVTDFDGPIGEIGPDPARSVALPGALDALRRLSRTLKKVVVLSSRTPDELSRLVPVAGVRLVGDSGLPPPNADEKRALEQFNAEAAKLLGAYPGVWVEVKAANSTVHLPNAH